MSALRACYGIALCVWGPSAMRVVVRRDLQPAEVWVVRLLGLRQVAQAAVSGRSPSRATVLVGAEVDALHAVSMVAAALGTGDRPRRRAEWLDGGLAACWMAAGVLAACRMRVADVALPPSGRGPGTRFVRWRDRVAEQVARSTLPRGVRGWTLGKERSA